MFLIQKKEVFTDKSDVQEMSNSLQGNYYKIVKSTQPVQNIQQDAIRQFGQTNRRTVVHGEAPESPYDINSIFKIEGIEYLPEGFLELEPFLL